MASSVISCSNRESKKDMNTTNRGLPETIIGNLMIHDQGSQLDRHILYQRIERLLNGAELHPCGLTSGAVLIVRTLPGLPALSVAALAHSTQVAWLDSLHEQVMTLYATAARPISGQVSPQAVSVLFSDLAEMLVCLTRDLLDGRAWQQWYWQQPLHNKPHTISATLTAVWSEHVTSLPIASGSLQPAELYVALSHLSQSEILHIIHTLHNSFDLPPTVSVTLRQSDASPSAGAAPQSITASSREVFPADTSFAPPWQRWLPSVPPPALTPQKHYLLGLVLTLCHAPAFARSSLFATQTVRWLRNMQGSAHAQERTLLTAHTLDVPTHTAAIEPSQQQDTGDTAPMFSGERATNRHPPAKISASLTGEAEPPYTDSFIGHREVSQASIQPAVTSEHLPAERAADQAGKATLPQGTFPARSAHAFVFNTVPHHPLSGIPTELGGVFYLINLLTRLHLPGCWGEDETLAEHLSGWAMIEALARGLLVDNPRMDDPIWSILAQLDQRNANLSEATLRWQERVPGLIHHTLASMLGEPALTPEQRVELLLCQRGNVLLSRTHIDLHMSMEQISIPVRRSGLDRDPGWVPDLGRIILFHFE